MQEMSAIEIWYRLQIVPKNLGMNIWGYDSMISYFKAMEMIAITETV